MATDRQEEAKVERADIPSDAGGVQQTETAETSPDGSSSQEAAIPDGISTKVQRSFELVPSIGMRWRWYDAPYRLLSWSLSSWRRRLLPWRLRHWLNSALNFFITFNHYERLKVQPLDDPMENLIVPPGEEVTQGGIWVAEFFPPSYYPGLYEALQQNGWDRQNHLRAIDGTNAERVTQARRGKGFAWSHIGSVANPDSAGRVVTSGSCASSAVVRFQS